LLIPAEQDQNVREKREVLHTNSSTAPNQPKKRTKTSKRTIRGGRIWQYVQLEGFDEFIVLYIRPALSRFSDGVGLPNLPATICSWILHVWSNILLSLLLSGDAHKRERARIKGKGLQASKQGTEKVDVVRRFSFLAELRRCGLCLSGLRRSRPVYPIGPVKVTNYYSTCFFFGIK
jgi:hypothetical protein